MLLGLLNHRRQPGIFNQVTDFIGIFPEFEKLPIATGKPVLGVMINGLLSVLRKGAGNYMGYLHSGSAYKTTTTRRTRSYANLESLWYRHQCRAANHP